MYNRFRVSYNMAGILVTLPFTYMRKYIASCVLTRENLCHFLTKNIADTVTAVWGFQFSLQVSSPVSLHVCMLAGAN